MKRKKVLFKGIINYIFAMVFAIIFALFLEANVGWFIVLTLLLAPLLSVFLAWLSSRSLVLNAEMEETLLSKGDVCTLQVSVHNHSIFPTPPIEVQMTEEAGVAADNSCLLVTVLPKTVKEFEVVFRAEYCGPVMVGIQGAWVTDYLGLFSFPIKGVELATMQKRVAVIPGIAEISARDDNLKKVMQSSLQADDSDDTVESSRQTFGGFPGYDNREYVPGDPIKRINWKQSAKRNKLLVRMDDEMASKAVNMVLDSVFSNDGTNAEVFTSVSRVFKNAGLKPRQIFAKIFEDTVESALGLMQVLIRHGYTINFYAMLEGSFRKYEVKDELDLDAVRLELAYFQFAREDMERLPGEEVAFQDKVSMFCTPNSYENAYAALGGQTDAFYTNIYSVMEEEKKRGGEEYHISLQESTQKQEEKSGLKKGLSVIAPLVIPYCLALLLSISVFGVFKVPVRSWWTVGQVIMCAAVIAFCVFVQKHRLLGTLFIVLGGVADIYLVVRLIGMGGSLLTYTYWFVSGGDEIASVAPYLMTLLLIFTVFFGLVVYYFTQVLYRTSFLMLVSLIPFVIYVKVMLDIDMVQVVFITVLNVAAFLMHNRTNRDAGKGIVGYKSGLISFGLYALMFVLIGLAVPEMDTKYYYMFENAFLGGNVSERVPQEYSEMSEHSGNADGFNEMNNRKLYVITGVEPGMDLYMNRQVFDQYDFEKDYWVPSAEYNAHKWPEEWEADWSARNLWNLIEALRRVQELEPELVAEYGLDKVLAKIPEMERKMQTFQVEALNFQSASYITPSDTVRVEVLRNDAAAMKNTMVTLHGNFYVSKQLLNKDVEYLVTCYDETTIRNAWIAAGGANYDVATLYNMLFEMEKVLSENGEAVLAETVYQYLVEMDLVIEYQLDCEANTKLIPDSVRNLALEITKDCIYDWEKANALQNYFRQNDFVYDLDYDAPDDSVEYFLFEGKTGTCSDFASAYVLMARASGLIVRYTEGFVPDIEYNGDYVVRANNGHAYPAVYIPGAGYKVYEATIPARYQYGNRYGSAMLAYVLTVVARIVYVFALVSAVILVVLFVGKVAAPYVNEQHFRYKVKKADAGQSVVLLYRRLQQRHARNVLKKGGFNTPYEYAERFEELLGFDISELALLVEQTVYAEEFVSEEQKTKAEQIYRDAKEAIQTWKKQSKKMSKKERSARN